MRITGVTRSIAAASISTTGVVIAAVREVPLIVSLILVVVGALLLLTSATASRGRAHDFVEASFSLLLLVALALLGALNTLVVMPEFAPGQYRQPPWEATAPIVAWALLGIVGTIAIVSLSIRNRALSFIKFLATGGTVLLAAFYPFITIGMKIFLGDEMENATSPAPTLGRVLTCIAATAAAWLIAFTIRSFFAVARARSGSDSDDAGTRSAHLA